MSAGVIRFRYDVPLAETMAFEAVYPEQLQMDLEDKQYLREMPGALFVWMYVDGEIAGETYGVPFDPRDEFIEPILEGKAEVRERGMHCYSNTILPKFQSRHLGMVLKSHWLGMAAGQGYKWVYGHARHGASQALNAKFGAEFLKSYENWFGTGEEYRLYRMRIG